MTDTKTMHSPALRELEYRGLLQQCTDLEALDRALTEGSLTLYAGFDPTGSSLHIGHIVPLFAMAHLARAGHRVIALIGGGTARVGDPSGKTEMRKMLSLEQISDNAEKIGGQIRKFFGAVGVDPGLITILNNEDWLGGLNYLEFLRDIGRHFSVNRMLSFEAYKQRLENGLSFIEFNYQLLQSFDFMVLNRDHGVSLQVGGDDQWGNIVAGIDLIRRTGGPVAHGLTFPLISRADGKKMGKSEKGAIFLDPKLCSPFELFQYWRNTLDQDLPRFLRMFTFLPREEVEALAQLRDQEINRAKEVLAYEYTKLIHGKEEAEAALKAARALFASGGFDNSSVPSMEIPAAELEAGISVVELFARTGLCASRGEARRLVEQGGARINDVQITSIDALIGSDAVVEGALLLKAGKKRHFRVLVSRAE